MIDLFHHYHYHHLQHYHFSLVVIRNRFGSKVALVSVRQGWPGNVYIGFCIE